MNNRATGVLEFFAKTEPLIVFSNYFPSILALVIPIQIKNPKIIPLKLILMKLEIKSLS